MRSALFYEFCELTPIGRRGDEMIWRIAGRGRHAFAGVRTHQPLSIDVRDAR
jgi:hypothetical protein